MIFFFYHSKIWSQQGCIKLIKSDSKDIYNVTKKKQKKKKRIFAFKLYQKNPENEVYHGFHKNIKQHNCFQHW